jgi:cysteinyl-tRNA synthetase
MLRYFLLGTHYRSPLDFSDQSLSEAKNAADGFYGLFTRLEESGERTTADKGLMEAIERCKVAFRAAMDDDFNTPVAIAELQRLKSDVNKLLSQGLSTEGRKIARDEFRSLGNNLGLFQLEKWQSMPANPSIAFRTVPFIQPDNQVRLVPPQFFQVSQKSELSKEQIEQSAVLTLTDEVIEEKLQERNEARKQKNFKKADEIRQFLASRGIAIEDKPDGTSRWKR